MNRTLLLAVSSLISLGGFAGSANAQATSCPQLIADTEVRRQIPRGLLMAIAITESGVGGAPNPYAMNIAGRSYHARDFNDMANVINRNWQNGVRSIDVGCMQVNLRYHGHHFQHLTDLLNPTTNVEYGASYLIRLAADKGSWREGVMDYHNKSNPARRRWYGCLVWNNYLRINHSSSGFLACGRSPGGSSTASSMRANTKPLVIAGYNDGSAGSARFTQATFQHMHSSSGSIGGIPLISHRAQPPARRTASNQQQGAPVQDIPSGSPLNSAAGSNEPTGTQPQVEMVSFDVPQPRQRVRGEIELAPPGTDMADVTTSSDDRASAFQAVHPLDWAKHTRNETIDQVEAPSTSSNFGGFTRIGPSH